MTFPSPVNAVRADGWLGSPYFNSNGPTDTPFVRDGQVHAMTPDWNTMAAVTRGSDYIKNLHDRYLPQEPRESDDAYQSRIYRSVLSPFCLRLIENAAGLVLRRPISVDGDTYWKDFSKNVDGLGSSINEYARRALVSSLTYGHSAVLIDYPTDPGIRTLRDELLLGRRPYFINIDAPKSGAGVKPQPFPAAPSPKSASTNGFASPRATSAKPAKNKSASSTQAATKPGTQKASSLPAPTP